MERSSAATRVSKEGSDMATSAFDPRLVLRIAGVAHKDPAIRPRLIEWLAEISEVQGNPSFVAVEWDKGVFESVKAKRVDFRSRLKGQWPRISDNLLNTLTLSLAYEGDAHVEVHPYVETVWLDQGRAIGTQPGDYQRGFVNHYPLSVLGAYKGFVGAHPLGSDDFATLSRMSCAANAPQAQPPYGLRDAKFANIIHDASSKHVPGANKWALVIVGNEHALDIDGSMRHILETMGYRCEHISFIGPGNTNASDPRIKFSRTRQVLGGSARGRAIAQRIKGTPGITG